MKPKRVSQKQIRYAAIAYAAGLFILSLLGLFNLANFDNEIVAILYGVMLGVTISRVIHSWLTYDKDEDVNEEITILRLLDESSDETIDDLAREMRKRGIKL